MLILFTLLFSFAQNTYAGSLTVPAQECSCHPNEKDNFEEPIKFNFGKNTGSCVDACKFRRPIIIERNSDQIIVANLLHNEKYWTAKIPLYSVKDVYGDFEEFLPKIAHFFLRFRFIGKDPIQLVSQDGKKEKSSLHDLVISVEGVPANKDKYSLFESLLGHYLLGYRLLSIDTVKNFSIKKLKHPISQYRLHISPTDVAKILRSSLEISDKNGFRSIYALFNNNCATSAVDILDGDKNVGDWERGIPILAPLGTFRALQSRGLIGNGEGSRIHNLEDEIAPVQAKMAKGSNIF